MAQATYEIEIITRPSPYPDVAPVTRTSFIEACVDAQPYRQAYVIASAWDALHDHAPTAEGGHDEIDEDP